MFNWSSRVRDIELNTRIEIPYFRAPRNHIFSYIIFFSSTRLIPDFHQVKSDEIENLLLYVRGRNVRVPGES